MCEVSTEFDCGDEVVWWADSHGRGLPADHPDAVQRTGTVASVHRHPEDHARIVAYLVTCQGGAAGTYLATVRPDHGHQLTPAVDE
ncbi:hypothetical protein ACFQZZ_33210 [Nocardia sp. GCM10030253]|uniref:hypothetical protein n=1 Tax=Nocardia sp. GCM10030253 TaxID=3273404 RepID=UPI00362E3333